MVLYCSLAVGDLIVTCVRVPCALTRVEELLCVYRLLWFISTQRGDRFILPAFACSASGVVTAAGRQFSVVFVGSVSTGLIGVVRRPTYCLYRRSF